MTHRHHRQRPTTEKLCVPFHNNIKLNHHFPAFCASTPFYISRVSIYQWMVWGRKTTFSLIYIGRDVRVTFFYLLLQPRAKSIVRLLISGCCCILIFRLINSNSKYNQKLSTPTLGSVYNMYADWLSSSACCSFSRYVNYVLGRCVRLVPRVTQLTLDLPPKMPNLFSFCFYNSGTDSRVGNIIIPLPLRPYSGIGS
jgi:hypothetical protein